MVELDPVEIADIPESRECIFSDDLSVGATWACRKTAEQAELYSDLCKIFGKNDGSNLLRLGIYQYLATKPLSDFEDWISDVYLPDAEELNEQEINALLSRVDYGRMHSFFRSRLKRIQKSHKKSSDRSLQQEFLAVESTGLFTYPTDCGPANQNSELKQSNLTLVIDRSCGDICYAVARENSVNDGSVEPTIFENIDNLGIDLTRTILVTDRNCQNTNANQRKLTHDFQYVQGVPLVNKEIVDQLKKYYDSLQSIAFPNGSLGISAVNVEDTGLNLYRDPGLVAVESIQILTKIEEVIEAKNAGKTVNSLDWQQVGQFVRKTQEGKWEKNIESLSEWEKIVGCFAIRSNCIKDPFEVLNVYRRKIVAEKAFRQYLTLNSCAKPYGFGSTDVGQLMVHLIAQSLRMIHWGMLQKAPKGTVCSDDSTEKAMAILSRVRAQRSAGRQSWTRDKISKKAQDVFALLDVPLPPTRLVVGEE